MKKVLFACCFTYVSFAIAHEPPQILQTLLPAISSDLLAVRAQLAPQTQSHRETHEEEIARLKTQYETKEQEVTQLVRRIKNLEQTLAHKETELSSTRNTVIQYDAELEKLKESLHRVTYVSINQKVKIEEQEHLLEIATREIVEHQSAQEDQQRRITEVISNGYKKLEQMKASQKERGLLT